MKTKEIIREIKKIKKEIKNLEKETTLLSKSASKLAINIAYKKEELSLAGLHMEELLDKIAKG